MVLWGATAWAWKGRTTSCRTAVPGGDEVASPSSGRVTMEPARFPEPAWFVTVFFETR